MPTSADVPVASKVAFLAGPAAYPHRPSNVTVLETHMAWVFLTGTLVYKFKKPVRFPFLDYSSLADRRRHCAGELLLNQRQARCYRRLVPLRCDAAGRLALDGDGETVEWLIEMDQLPREAMLDARIADGRLERGDVERLGDTLAGFYSAAPPVIAGGDAYLAHLDDEWRQCRALLPEPGLGLGFDGFEQLLDRVEAALATSRPAILARIAAGRIVEGHGDLRPEHVCLVEPLEIIDCLEFDRAMRVLDPYDEVNYLGLECAMLGAGWVRPLLLERLAARLGHAPEPELLRACGAFRAVLRSRICLAHLLDGPPAEAGRWQAEARRYLARAADELGPHAAAAQGSM